VIHPAKTGRVVNSMTEVTSIHHKNSDELYGLELLGEFTSIVTKKFDDLRIELILAA